MPVKVPVKVPVKTSVTVLVGLLVALLAGSGLTGCQPRRDAAASLADYNNRLAHLLAQELPVIAPTRVPPWPMTIDSSDSPPAVRYSLFGFPDAGRCSLLQEISANERADLTPTPPQQWLRAMQLARALGQCAQLTRDDLQSSDVTRRAFAVAVHDALSQQQDDLGRLYWRATFASAGFREFFSVGVPPLRMGEGGLADEAAAAIAWLADQGRLRADAPLPSTEHINAHYYRLLGNKLGGRSWLAIDLAWREIERGSALLESASPAALCPSGQPNDNAQKLLALYNERYARLQPWLRENERAGQQLSRALEQLWQAQQITPPPELMHYRAALWLNQPHSLVYDYSQALTRHEHAWQVLRDACGVNR